MRTIAFTVDAAKRNNFNAFLVQDNGAGLLDAPSFHYEMTWSLTGTRPIPGKLAYVPDPSVSLEDCYLIVSILSGNTAKGVAVIPLSALSGRNITLSGADVREYAITTTAEEELGILRDIPMHHWGVTSTMGMSIGHKAALFAGQAAAQCVYDIMRDPSPIPDWKRELAESTRDLPRYQPVLPEKTEEH